MRSQVKQTAKGIAYLHEISIVHGDLKAVSIARVSLSRRYLIECLST